MVSIAAFQAVDPGSTPGHRNPFFCMNQYFYSIIIERSNISGLNDFNDLEVGNQCFIYTVKYIVHEGAGFSINILTLNKVLVKRLYFPRRELNPGLLGESQLS